MQYIREDMSPDRVYTYLIDAIWVFVGSWLVTLLAAYLAAFGHESTTAALKRMK